MALALGDAAAAAREYEAALGLAGLTESLRQAAERHGALTLTLTPTLTLTLTLTLIPTLTLTLTLTLTQAAEGRLAEARRRLGGAVSTEAVREAQAAAEGEAATEEAREAAREEVAREAEAREAEAGEVRAAEPPPCPPSAEGGDARLTRGASVGDVEAEAALEQLAHASREAGAELIRTKQA